MNAMKGVRLVVVVMALAACTEPTRPIDGPDVKSASDEALEKTLRDCIRYGRHGENGAKYTQDYCIKTAEESFRRLRARRKT